MNNSFIPHFLIVLIAVFCSHLYYNSFLYTLIESPEVSEIIAQSLYLLEISILLIFVLYLGQRCFDRRDYNEVKRVFIYMFCGSLLFIANKFLLPPFLNQEALAQLVFGLGNFLYMGMLLQLAFRNSKRKNSTLDEKKDSYLKIDRIILIIVLSLSALFILQFIFTTHTVRLIIAQTAYIGSSVLYAGVLIFTLIQSFKSLSRHYFKGINIVFLIVGILLFTFCETGMAFSIVFSQQTLSINIITTAYFTPAFIFIALSTVNWEEHKAVFKG